ncbi:MAG: sulfatase-like hydrolase/transferase, partial [bacterium]|nr:sulfatase-like hydrolase/transferase [bacterium]
MSNASESLSAAKPNILLIYADDLGYGDLGCYGATKLATPAIDSLARDGIRFTDAHSPSTICTPSRYGLLTGRYPWRPESCWAYNYTALLIDPGRPTLPSMLKKAGYATACFGKWHLGLGGEDARQDWSGLITPGPREVGFDDSLVRAEPNLFVHNGRVLGLAEGDELRMVPVEGKAKAYRFAGGKSARRFNQLAQNAFV